MHRFHTIAHPPYPSLTLATRSAVAMAATRRGWVTPMSRGGCRCCCCWWWWVVVVVVVVEEEEEEEGGCVYPCS
jgi:hypothetical protein